MKMMMGDKRLKLGKVRYLSIRYCPLFVLSVDDHSTLAFYARRPDELPCRARGEVHGSNITSLPEHICTITQPIMTQVERGVITITFSSAMYISYKHILSTAPQKSSCYLSIVLPSFKFVLCNTKSKKPSLPRFVFSLLFMLEKMKCGYKCSESVVRLLYPKVPGLHGFVSSSASESWVHLGPLEQ